MNRYDANTTASEVIEGISLQGRTAVVTGASSGLGIETARVLAQAGATVVLLARDAEKLAAVVRSLEESLPGARLDTGIVDLADLNSVRAAAAAILESHSDIHLLINNAGVMACPLVRTAQGFEMQFGTNHLGHFLLTGLLLPALSRGAVQGPDPSRVVALSSTGHKFSGIIFEDPNFERGDYDKWIAYGQSKTANSLFAVGLDQRMQDAGVRGFAVHPGMIMTDLGRHMLPEDFDRLNSAMPTVGQMKVKTVEQGSATSVWAATSPELAVQGGLYLEDCRIAQPAAPGIEGGVEPYAVDPVAAERLWKLSEDLVDWRLPT